MEEVGSAYIRIALFALALVWWWERYKKMEIMSIHVYIFPFYDYYDYVCDTIKEYTQKKMWR